MNSIAHAGCSAGETSAEKMRAASRHKIGRIRFPPANTLYRIASWMEVGGVPETGSIRCNAASTSSRSSSKKEGSFIAKGAFRPAIQSLWRHQASRFILAFWLKLFRHQFAVRFFQQNLNFAFRLFQLLLAFPRKRHSLFKQLHRFIQRKLRALQFAHHLFQSRQRPFEVRLFLRFRFFRCWYVHAAFSLGARLSQRATISLGANSLAPISFSILCYGSQSKQLLCTNFALLYGFSVSVCFFAALSAASLTGATTGLS